MTFPSFSVGEVLTASDMNAVGLWKVGTYTVSAQTTLTCDNCFSSSYANYHVVVSIVGTTDINTLRVEMLNSTGGTLATNYGATAYGYDYFGGGTTITAQNSTTNFVLGWLPNSASHGPIGVTFDIYEPFVSGTKTAITGNHAGVNSGSSFQGGFLAGVRSVAETNRGMRFLNSDGTNMTGTVQVYGYRD